MTEKHRQRTSVRFVKSGDQGKTSTTNTSPFAWLPYYLPPEEMEAVWRHWGWRVLGEEPVAEAEREAFEIVCRQLQTNWGAVYRPVAMLPPRHPTASSQAQVRLFNQCLAAGWHLQHVGLALTAAALASAVGEAMVVVTPLIDRVVAALHAAEDGANAGGIATPPLPHRDGAHRTPGADAILYVDAETASGRCGDSARDADLNNAVHES